jgi:hypothetical protein
MLGGYAAGVSDAQKASAVCASLGHPTDRPIYFSADFDASPSQQGTIDAYLSGVASVIGLARTGIYGGYWVVKRCFDNGSARWAWQAAAWSGGNVDPRIHIFQHVAAVIVGGVECDVNEARQPDFGQHPVKKKETTEMIRLPATVTPTDPKTSPLTWPQRNFDIPWNVAGGWEGNAAFSFGVQDWNSGRADAVRGFLLLASWMMPDGKLIPVDSVFTVAGMGQALTAHTLTKEYPAPAGCVGVTLNYAAPGEAYVAIGRSG